MRQFGGRIAILCFKYCQSLIKRPADQYTDIRMILEGASSVGVPTSCRRKNILNSLFVKVIILIVFIYLIFYCINSGHRFVRSLSSIRKRNSSISCKLNFISKYHIFFFYFFALFDKEVKVKVVKIWSFFHSSMFSKFYVYRQGY